MGNQCLYDGSSAKEIFSMSVGEVIGRFHPLLVHLPIGILLLAIALDWLSQKERFILLQPAIPIILLIGAFTALFSCITGYLLSQSGEYDGDAVGWHQWMGISFMLVSFLYAWIKIQIENEMYSKVISVIALMLLTITGHLGGSLTHGEDYLTEGLFSKSTSTDFSKIDIEKARYYSGLVQPILESKCYTCHNTSKQKGKLRLDERDYILKGGKGGVVLVAHKVDESEMIDRLLLPLDEKKHMPPKEKSQLSQTEIELLKNWIASGADFEKTISELKQVNQIKAILNLSNETKLSDVPIEEVSAADEATITKLKQLEVMIVPVAQNSNYLSVNLINTTNIDSSLLILQNLKQQVIWLKAGSTTIKDAHLKSIGSLTNLTHLNLDDTKLTGKGLSDLKPLTHLLYLNLSNTQIATASVVSLSSLKNLKSLYLYNTTIKNEELPTLQKAFASTKIELVPYQVPSLPTDTVVVKPK
ncbi:MAG: c-type cytochrome domain-containing protein [Cyclobacteriaceae bacterium]